MALEHIVGIAVIGLLNWKVIRNMEIWDFDKSKTFLDLSTILIVLLGVGLELIGSFDPYVHVGTILFFEVMGIVFALLVDKVFLVKKAFKDIDKIKPLDL